MNLRVITRQDNHSKLKAAHELAAGAKPTA